MHDVNQRLPPEQAALLVAVTLGERSGIPSRISEAFLDSDRPEEIPISSLTDITRIG